MKNLRDDISKINDLTREPKNILDNPLSMEEVKKFGEEMRKVDWNDHNQRRAIANTIVKRLQNEHDQFDVVRLFATVQQFAEGDTMQFATQKGGKAYVHSPGSAAPRSTIVQRIQTLDAETVSVMLEFELDQLRAGRYGNVNTIRGWARRALAYRKYKIVWDTLRGSITSADAGYFSIPAASGAQAKVERLDDAIDYAEDQIDGAAAIVGRRTDLNFLLRWTDSNSGIQYSDRTKDSILNKGVVPVYRGIPIIGLNSYKDSYNAEMIASGEIAVVNDSTVQVGVNRSVEALDRVQIDTRIWELHLSEKYGVAVFFPERNAKVVFT